MAHNFTNEINELKELMMQVPDSDKVLTEEFLKQNKRIALNSHLL
jgi:hypothetical protein